MFDLFYRNRRLLALALALIVVTGLSSSQVLPRLEDPTLKKRAGKIVTHFPGATAARVESLVTEVIEKKLEEIEDIRILRSASRKDTSTITMELHDHVSDVENVWSRVRDKLNDVEPSLPEGASKPQFEDMHFRAYALLVALRWDRRSPVNYNILRREAEELESRLRQIYGTDIVDTFGAPQEEVSVLVNKDKLAALGLSIGRVAQALRASDAKVSAGGLRSPTSDSVVEVRSEFQSLNDIQSVPLMVNGPRAVTVADIAAVHKQISVPFTEKVMIGGDPAIVLGCLVQPAMRIDQWNVDARQVCERFARDLPRAIRTEVLMEQNEYVMRRLSSLLLNLVLASSAVTVVIFLMMGWRSALVVGLALPLASLMVLGGLRLFDVPLHQMSVTGLIIALGLLIDNAIVVVDETRAALRRGQSPAGAISSSVRHLIVPLFGSTFTTALAFAPLALMPGPAGEFVGSIGLSVILAVSSSLFLSLTIIPAILGLVENAESLRKSSHWWQVGLGTERLYRGYRWALYKLFSWPWFGLGIGLLLPTLGFWNAGQLPEQFFPASDRSQFLLTLNMNGAVSIDKTEQTARQIRNIATSEFPDIQRVDWYLGQSAPAYYYNMLSLRRGVPSYAQAFVQVAEGCDVTELVNRLQVRLDREITRGQILAKQLEQGPPIDAPILIRIYGNNLDRLKQVGEQVRARMLQIPNVIYAYSDMSNTSIKEEIVIDEARARRVGLTHQDIAQQTAAALDGIAGGSLLEDTESLPLKIRWDDQRRGDVSELRSLDLLVPDNGGKPAVRIPLTSIAQVETVPHDAAVERIAGNRMNEIQVTVTAGVLASTVLREFKQRMADDGFSLPAGYAIQFAGESEERNRAVGNLMASAGVLAVLMVAGLVLSFQSFRIAGLIGTVAMLSAGLGLFALWWFGYPFGFMAIVGIMGLVGVAINDSIVVLAAIRKDDEARLAEVGAISRVVFRASRHVFSTTLTTIAGFTPLLIAGGGFWPPLAIAIAGGVSGATLLALYFVPSAYILLMKLSTWGVAARNTPLPKHEVPSSGATGPSAV